ncbi:MAG: hypothetical protein ACXW36_10875, partial [Nitrospira sp.]
MTRSSLQRMVGSSLILLILVLGGFSAPVAAGEIRLDQSSPQVSTPAIQQDALQQTQVPVMPSLPLLLADFASASNEDATHGNALREGE